MICKVNELAENTLEIVLPNGTMLSKMSAVFLFAKAEVIWQSFFQKKRLEQKHG